MSGFCVPTPRAWYRRVPTRATPLALFEALYAGEAHAFLYESLEAHGQRGRYSFIGSRPRAIFSSRGEQIELRVGQRCERMTGDALAALRGLLATQADAPPVAPFCGGAVGYLGYDMVRQCERLPEINEDDLGLPHCVFLFPREVICFDHLEKLVHVILYEEAGHEQRLAEIVAAAERAESRDPELRRVRGAAGLSPAGRPAADEAIADLKPAELGRDFRSNLSREQFEAMVERAREYIRAGDIFQVVLSQRFEFEVSAEPLRLYEALRVTNPSPYMYYLKLDELQVVGSSPEVLVSLTGRRCVTRPLAGTRRRGRTAEEDLALARELQNDPKERAEHVMLVDLGRNDLGRVCEFGSVQVANVLEIEYHSRVMHLVSTVEGWLRADRDALDVFRAAFPAGTVSGAPKVRAMEIIEALEPHKRGVYAGAIGYFSLLGDMDLCIAIRTIVLKGRRGFIQAGAGVVADSVPALEYKETLNKAQALFRAVRLAQRWRSAGGVR